MLKRVLTGASLLVVTAACFLADRSVTGGWCVGGLGVVLTLGALYELLAMTQAKAGRRQLGMIAGVVWIGVLAWSAARPNATGLNVADVLVVASLVAGIAMARFIPQGPGPVSYKLSRSLWFCVPYVGGLGCLVALVVQGDLMFAVGISLVGKSSDIGAYFAGRSFGRRKLAPKVSPNKTWEGAAGGILLPALVAPWLVADVGATAVPGGVAGAALLGAVTGCVAIVSDLTESIVKRSCDVKDSGRLLGEAGGLLDLADTLLLVGPLALIYTALLA